MVLSITPNGRGMSGHLQLLVSAAETSTVAALSTLWAYVGPPVISLIDIVGFCKSFHLVAYQKVIPHGSDPF